MSTHRKSLSLPKFFSPAAISGLVATFGIAVAVAAALPCRAAIISAHHRGNVQVRARADDDRVSPFIMQKEVTGEDVDAASASVSRNVEASVGRGRATAGAAAWAYHKQTSGSLFVSNRGTGMKGLPWPDGFRGDSSSFATAASTIAVSPGTGTSTHFKMVWAFSAQSGGLLGPLLDGGQTDVPTGSVAGLLNGDAFDIRLSTGSSGGSGNHGARGAVIWSLDSDLPGITPANPFPDEEDDVANEPVQVSGSWFTSPSAAGYGADTALFFKTAAVDQGSGVFRTGDALFVSDGIPFAGVVAPAATPALGAFTLQFDEQEVLLPPGSTFNFLDAAPGGVSSFRLLGLGDVVSNDLSQLSSYSTGIVFAEEGLARFLYQLLAVRQSGDFNDDGVVDAADYVVWQDAFGEIGLGNATGDGLTAGEDLLAWQREFGRTSTAAASIPEPGVLGLAWVAVWPIAALRRRRAFG